MKIVTPSEAAGLPLDEQQQCYNVLDCCVPHGALARLLEELDDDTSRVYGFERAMQGPAFTMAVRGMCVDEAACAPVVAELEAAEAKCQAMLDAMAEAWGVPGCNPASPAQVKNLLYQVCREKPYHSRGKRAGENPETVDEEALKDLSIRNPLIGTIATTVLRCRELHKAASVVKARRAPNGRLQSSFNVGATKFGRWSSSMSVFKEGLNFFNLPRSARRMIVPSSPSRILVNIDLKQAESYIVACIARDEAYKAAHRTGNVHTQVACDVLGLTPEQVKAAGKDTGSPYYKAKRLQHGTNYGLGERHAARLMGVRLGIMRELREKYFSTYRGVARRIRNMPGRLRDNSTIVSPMGRPHTYLGAYWDHDLVKEALAGEPQGTIADILNISLYRIWLLYDGTILWLLNQNYDSLLFECELADHEATIELVKREMEVHVSIYGEDIVVGCDISTGRNWQEASG